PYFGTTILGAIDDRLLWVMTTGSVMAGVVGSDGTIGSPRLVLEDVLVRPGGAAKAAMSPSGSLIYQRGVSVSQLVLIDERGEKTSFGPEPGAFAHPRWAPDGSRIAVSVARTGGLDIWLIDARTKSLTKLTNEVGSSDNAEWTPDSKRIIYRSI